MWGRGALTVGGVLPKLGVRELLGGVKILLGKQSPHHQLEGLGERCKVASGVWGTAPAAERFSCILEVPHGLSFSSHSAYS